MITDEIKRGCAILIKGGDDVPPFCKPELPPAQKDDFYADLIARRPGLLDEKLKRELNFTFEYDSEYEIDNPRAMRTESEVYNDR